MSRKRVEVDGRTAFVSGAASGMGRAVALRLAAHGCPVAIVDQDEDGLRETEELISGPVLARKLDVRDRQAQMAFAAGAEDAARRGADSGFVDEPERERAGVGKAIDREEQIERGLGLEEANASGLGKPFA